MKSTLLFCLLFAASLFWGCEKDSPANLLVNSPECRIVNKLELVQDSVFHFSKIKVRVQNTGEGPTAYNIGCYIKLKQGDFIVDQNGCGFGTLREGESVEYSVYFSKAKSSNDYSYMEVKLYWYDAQNKYYNNQ